ncbi:diguanylate cyclase (GGDEF)-like protein [Pseudomonas sp. TE3786]
MRRCARVITLLLCWLAACSCSAALVQLQDDSEPLRLGPQLEYLLPQQPLQFVDAQRSRGWQAVNADSLNLGHQEQAVWVRMHLLNIAAINDWLLVVEWPILDRADVRLYYPQSRSWGTTQSAGDHLPFSSWPVAERQLVFPLSLEKAEEAWVYMRVSSKENLVLPMQIYSSTQFQAQEKSLRMLLGMFFGAMLAILLYNASLYLFTRHPSYAWYTVYLLGVIVYELSISGIGPLYVWPELGKPARQIYALSAFWSFFAAAMFIRAFLHLPRFGGWPLWTNNLLALYWVVALLLTLVQPDWVYWIGINQVALASCILALVVAISAWRRGNSSAPLFILAWSFLIVCTFVHVAALEGLLPINQVTLRMQTLGFFVEFILLSIALADRLNRERAARLEAQHSLLEAREQALATQQQILEVQRRTNEELELRVQERTSALQRAKQDLEEANGELTRISHTDALTQLANRRYCDQQLAHLNDPALAVLMIDIDHFKRVNDTYGHPFGDTCISAVAQVLKQATRRSADLAARYGGEEFVVLLRDSNPKDAHELAEQIRLAVGGILLEAGEEQVKLTVSIGVACNNAERPLDVQALLSAADRALYAAKQGGRNQVQGVQALPA